MFENRQNYRGTNADIDIRGIDRDDHGTSESGSGTILADFDGGNDDSFNGSLLIADFNLNYVTADGSSLADLVYSIDAGSLDNAPLGAGRQQYDNELFASRGDDVLEGRGGDDWLEGREGNDIFLVSTSDDIYGELAGVEEQGKGSGGFGSFGDVVLGDNINIIARRLDDVGDGVGGTEPDGLVDTVGGYVTVGRDFRLDLPDGEDQTEQLVLVTIDPIDDNPNGIDRPGEPDLWNTFVGLTFSVNVGDEGEQIDVAIFDRNDEELDGNPEIFATTVAGDIQSALNDAFPTVDFVVSAAVDPEGVATDLDLILITYDPTALGGDQVLDVTDAIFVSRAEVFGNSAFTVDTEAFEDTIEGAQFFEDDEIVFRAYQNRIDDESFPDRQTSLGREAYAEDLVVGVQDGTTKLVEGQEYRIYIEDLKENDTVRLTFNGQTYTRTVDFAGGSTSQTTLQFMTEFAEQINDEIMRDPHSRDGWIYVEVVDEGGTDIGGEGAGASFIVRERERADDEAEHVFIKFPQVEIENNSGGDEPNVIVKETSDTSVVIFEYDYRDLDNDGLNRGVGVFEQRDGGTLSDDNRRFITFEGHVGPEPCDPAGCRRWR